MLLICTTLIIIDIIDLKKCKGQYLGKMLRMNIDALMYISAG